MSVVTPPWLVPERGMSPARWPLLCAMLLGYKVAVASLFVTAVVEYVCVATASALVCASCERKTRSKR